MGDLIWEKSECKSTIFYVCMSNILGGGQTEKGRWSSGAMPSQIRRYFADADVWMELKGNENFLKAAKVLSSALKSKAVNTFGSSQSRCDVYEAKFWLVE